MDEDGTRIVSRETAQGLAQLIKRHDETLVENKGQQGRQGEPENGGRDDQVSARTLKR
jgi:hypothetical protein